MRKKILHLGILTLLLSLLFLFNGCDNNKNTALETEIFVMDTFVTQKLYGENKKVAGDNVNNILLNIENKLSLYNDNSFVNEINKNAGIKPVTVDDYTYNLIKKGKEYSDKSNGLFDITVAPLSKLWGITSDNPRVPFEKEINLALELVNYNNIMLDDNNKTVMLKNKGMSIDLGGLAKGYLCQLIKDEYDNQGITSALVSIGGNIFVYSTKTDGDLYTLGIRDPLGSQQDIACTLKCKDKVVATTGEYERFFEQDGKRYHHILSTKTGYPVESDLLSVTVISEDGGLADFLSTTLYIAGGKNISSYINHSDFEVIVITKDMKVYCSDSLADSVTITNENYSKASLNDK